VLLPHSCHNDSDVGESVAATSLALWYWNAGRSPMDEWIRMEDIAQELKIPVRTIYYLG